MKPIYTAGYSGHTPAQLKSAADAMGALVIDIRHKPVSRIPGWNIAELHALMDGKSPARIIHMPDLGNLAVSRGGPMRLANEGRGIKNLLRFSAERPLILLCGCADAASCHRALVSQKLAAHGVHTQELEWPELDTGDLKALSLWQPWASLIACGAKRVETRGWATSYRGEIAIHAAKTTSQLDYCVYPFFWQAFTQARMWRIPEACTQNFTAHSLQQAFEELPIKKKLEWLPLPLGAVIAVANLVDCIPSEKILPTLSKQEMAFGDYGPKRWGWVMEDVRPLTTPVPYRGARQLFPVNRELLAGAFA